MSFTSSSSTNTTTGYLNTNTATTTTAYHFNTDTYTGTLTGKPPPPPPPLLPHPTLEHYDVNNVITSKGTIDILGDAEIIVIENIDNWMTGVARLYLLEEDFPLYTKTLQLRICPAMEGSRRKEYAMILRKIYHCLEKKPIKVSITVS